MRIPGLLIALLWLSLPTGAWCYDLLIVQSQRSPAYDEVLRGMRAATRFTERIVVLTDYNDVDLQRIVREESPVAIVTLGDKALTTARKVRQTPIIALMSLNYRAGMTGQSSLTGVEVLAPPERFLQLFASIKTHRVGVISHARTAAYIRQARKHAGRFGIELMVKEVKSPKEVSGQLNSMTGQVDALWMLPDSATASGEAADAHLLFSVAHKVPVITFSGAYLAAGAALALDLDRSEMGKQAGRMVAELLNGGSIEDIPPETPNKTPIAGNPSILRQLGLRTDLSDLKNSKLLP